MTQQDQVDELIDQRKKVYGDPRVTFPQIAQVFSGILGTEVRADQVPLLMIGMKLVRTSQTPGYSDNSDDIEGYLDIFRTVMGEDLVHARTVDEYVSELARHQQQHELLLNQTLPGHPIVTVDDDRIFWFPKGSDLTLYRVLPSMVRPGDFVTADGIRLSRVESADELFVTLLSRVGAPADQLRLPKDARVRFYTADEDRVSGEEPQ